jgi:hypothetical protein
MRFTIALVASLTLPAQAFALSCAQPLVENSYAFAAKSESTYLIGKGTLVFDPALAPRSTVGVERPPQMTAVPAKIKGQAFDGAGFNSEFEAEIQMVVRCLQSWCPVIETGKEQLVFLRQAETAYELAMDPCGGAAFTEPTPEMLDQVLTCFKEGTCTSDPS